MPTLKIINGIRFYFFSEEGNEPAHVHVVKGSGVAKYWLNPLKLVFSRRLNPNEQRKIKKLLKEHRDEWTTRYEER